MHAKRSRIFGLGETVLDLIMRDLEPVAARPGGSMLNGMVSLGRAGLPARFISEYGRDQAGELIDRFLRESGVNTSNVYRYSGGKTALALAFLDERNDAHYTFHRDFPDKRLDIRLPEVGPSDILLYGSYYAIAPEIRGIVGSFIERTCRNGACLVYDPNFRRAHLHEIDRLKPSIIENLQRATLVKGSDEDFRNIFGTTGPDEAWEAVRSLCPNLVYSANTGGVFVRTPSFSSHYPVPEITPVSTIGAGDNFTAGMIVELFRIVQDQQTVQVERLGQPEWDRIIGMGIRFATEVCLSYENSVSREFGRAVTGDR
ncbi:MAG: PfkB family carbohydrate kinase [Bacteroidales bacterium]